MLERRRCHPLYIVEQLARIAGVFVVYALVMGINIFAESGAELIGAMIGIGIMAVIMVVVLAIAALFTWIGWRNKWISAEDNTLIYESGILVKKRVTIPFSKINTIDMGRNIFQRIFGTCRLKIDTGALGTAEENTSQMNIVFSLKDAEEFRSYILGRAAQDEQELRKEKATAIFDTSEPRWAAKARFTDFIMYGFTSTSVWKILCTVVVFAAFFGELSSVILESALDAVTPYAESFWGFISGSGIIMLIIYILISYIIISIIYSLCSVCYSAIRYYGFRVAREGGNVVVRYGLLTQKNYTIQAENVHAVIVNQNLMQQIMKCCSVQMVSIGYGNEEKETNLLFPIIRTKKLGWLLDNLLPEYSLSVEAHKPEKRSVRFLIVRPIMWVTLFLAAGVIGCSFIFDSIVLPLMAAILILASVVIAGVLKYRTNAIGCDGKVVLVRNGGTSCRTHLIRVDAVQSVSAVSGIFQRPRKVANYQVDFHGPTLANIAVVNHLNDDLLPELNEYLFD